MVGPNKLFPCLLVASPLPGYLRGMFAVAEFDCSRGCTILFGFKVDSAAPFLLVAWACLKLS